MIKVGLVEMDDLLKDSLSICLDNHPEITVHFSQSNAQTIDDESINKIDLLILDTFEIDSNTIYKLRSNYPHLKLILLTSEENHVQNAVSTILNRKIKLNDLIAVILSNRTENMEEKTIQKSFRKAIQKCKTIRKSSLFTHRECEILSLIGKGKTTKEVSEELKLSCRTIEAHRGRMIEKLGCKNIIPVILYALEKDYLDIDPDKELVQAELALP